MRCGELPNELEKRFQRAGVGAEGVALSSAMNENGVSMKRVTAAS